MQIMFPPWARSARRVTRQRGLARFIYDAELNFKAPAVLRVNCEVLDASKLSHETGTLSSVCCFVVQLGGICSHPPPLLLTPVDVKQRITQGGALENYVQ